ncbi:MAG: hypothetical protein ACKO4T_06255 [Planctomycetaceae bacterium]
MTVAGTDGVADHGPPRSNPFATRFTKPGSIPPLAADGSPLDLEPLLEQLAGGCVAITGPHGSGNTTLVRALLAAAASRGRHASYVQVRTAADGLTAVRATTTLPRAGVIAIDGWERLPLGTGPLLAAIAGWRGVTVVTTAHRDPGIPVIATCRPTPAVIVAAVERLPTHGGLIDAEDLQTAYDAHRGNIRDAFADLYDRFESRSAGGRLKRS